jgi:hypothetical protein
LRMILLLYPAFHSVFSQDRLHLPYGDAGALAKPGGFP